MRNVYGKDFASVYNEKWAFWGPKIPTDASSGSSVDLFLAPSATFRGRTVGVNGKPVSHARVSLPDNFLRTMAGTRYNRAAPASESVRKETRPLETVSDNRGWFEIEGLPEGTARVVAEAPGYYGFSPYDVLVPQDDCIVVLAQTGTIAGQVAGISQEVLGQGLKAHCQTGIYTAEGMLAMGRPSQVEVASDGTFRIEEVVPGIHDVYFTLEGERMAPEPSRALGFENRHRVVVFSNQTTEFVLGKPAN